MAPRKPVTVDLDLDALAREATDTPEPFTFRLHGHVFSIAPGSDADFRVLDQINQDKIAEAVRLLLGEDQYAKFTEKSVSMRTLKALLSGWSEHKGVSLGE